MVYYAAHVFELVILYFVHERPNCYLNFASHSIKYSKIHTTHVRGNTILVSFCAVIFCKHKPATTAAMLPL